MVVDGLERLGVIEWELGKTREDLRVTQILNLNYTCVLLELP